MRILSIIFLSLIGALVANGTIQSYADPQLDTLLRIATQARDNLNINISQISNIPDEINQLYQQGSNETDALSKAVDAQNITLAQQHFLSAMKFFKATNDKINSLNATTSNDQQRADILQLQSEIARMNNIEKNLQTVAITNHVDINFTQFDQFIQQANQDINSGNVTDANKSIEAANNFVNEAHHSLALVAQQRTSDRAKDFTEKQIQRLDTIENTNASQNVVPIIPQLGSPAKTNSNLTVAETPKDMIAKLRKLVSEGNVDEALQVIKALRSYQNESPPTNPSNTTILNPPTNPSNTTMLVPSADKIPPTVTASPAGGNFTSPQSVTLTASEPATIYYTTNGNTPNTSSISYSHPISINFTTTLRFFAKDSAGNIGNPVSQTYRINTASTTNNTPLASKNTVCQNSTIAKVIAIGSDGNVPQNAVDRNLNTRWSNLGAGSWIKLDLGMQKTVCSIDIAWYNGDQRSNNFIISTSVDGTKFTNVYSGKSTGKTKSFESYDFKDTATRYVMITVKSNSENNWSSISEINVKALTSTSGTNTSTGTPPSNNTTTPNASIHPPSTTNPKVSSNDIAMNKTKLPVTQQGNASSGSKDTKLADKSSQKGNHKPHPSKDD